MAELADKAKIPAPVLSMIESGEVIPNERIQILIAQALKVDIEKLFPKEIFPEGLKSGQGFRKTRRSSAKRGKVR